MENNNFNSDPKNKNNFNFITIIIKLLIISINIILINSISIDPVNLNLIFIHIISIGGFLTLFHIGKTKKVMDIIFYILSFSWLFLLFNYGYNSHAIISFSYGSLIYLIILLILIPSFIITNIILLIVKFLKVV